jgi:hypothetical protein
MQPNGALRNIEGKKVVKTISNDTFIFNKDYTKVYDLKRDKVLTAPANQKFTIVGGIPKPITKAEINAGIKAENTKKVETKVETKTATKVNTETKKSNILTLAEGKKVDLSTMILKETKNGKFYISKDLKSYINPVTNTLKFAQTGKKYAMAGFVPVEVKDSAVVSNAAKKTIEPKPTKPTTPTKTEAPNGFDNIVNSVQKFFGEMFGGTKKDTAPATKPTETKAQQSKEYKSSPFVKVEKSDFVPMKTDIPAELESPIEINVKDPKTGKTGKMKVQQMKNLANKFREVDTGRVMYMSPDGQKQTYTIANEDYMANSKYSYTITLQKVGNQTPFVVTCPGSNTEEAIKLLANKGLQVEMLLGTALVTNTYPDRLAFDQKNGIKNVFSAPDRNGTLKSPAGEATTKFSDGTSVETGYDDFDQKNVILKPGQKGRGYRNAGFVTYKDGSMKILNFKIVNPDNMEEFQRMTKLRKSEYLRLKQDPNVISINLGGWHASNQKGEINVPTAQSRLLYIFDKTTKVKTHIHITPPITFSNLEQYIQNKFGANSEGVSFDGDFYVGGLDVSDPSKIDYNSTHPLQQTKMYHQNAALCMVVAVEKPKVNILPKVVGEAKASPQIKKVAKAPEFTNSKGEEINLSGLKEQKTELGKYKIKYNEENRATDFYDITVPKKVQHYKIGERSTLKEINGYLTTVKDYTKPPLWNILKRFEPVPKDYMVVALIGDTYYTLTLEDSDSVKKYHDFVNKVQGTRLNERIDGILFNDKKYSVLYDEQKGIELFQFDPSQPVSIDNLSPIDQRNYPHIIKIKVGNEVKRIRLSREELETLKNIKEKFVEGGKHLSMIGLDKSYTLFGPPDKNGAYNAKLYK